MSYYLYGREFEELRDIFSYCCILAGYTYNHSCKECPIHDFAIEEGGQRECWNSNFSEGILKNYGEPFLDAAYQIMRDNFIHDIENYVEAQGIEYEYEREKMGHEEQLESFREEREMNRIYRLFEKALRPKNARIFVELATIYYDFLKISGLPQLTTIPMSMVALPSEEARCARERFWRNFSQLLNYRADELD